MINIPVSEEENVLSKDVSAIVFPCSSFESHTLWKVLQECYGFHHRDLIQPRMTKSFLVDWVDFLGEQKEIRVNIWCWRVKVKGVWLCFVEPVGDMFSYNLVEDWLHGHFSCTYDGGRRRAFFNPMNFHNCVDALTEAIHKNTVEVGLK